MKNTLQRFFNFLFVFIFFLLVIAGAVLAFFYTQRDTILLQALRREAPKYFAELQIDSIVTRPIGRVSVELHGVIFRANKTTPKIKAPKLLLSSPLSLFEIYGIYLRRGVLPLNLQLADSTIEITDLPKSNAETTKDSEPPALMAKTVLEKLPVGLTLNFDLRDNTIITPRLTAAHISGVVKAGVNYQDENQLSSSGQVAFSVKTSNSAPFPLRFEWDAAGKTSGLALRKVKLAALGITLNGTGRYSIDSNRFQFSINGAAGDLSTIPLDENERQDLGISGRLAGALTVNLAAKGMLGESASIEGLVDLRKGLIPFQIDREKPSPLKASGPVGLSFSLPFKLDYNFADHAIEKAVVSSAFFQADFAAAELQLPGRLRKPKDTPLSLVAEWSIDGKTVYLNKCAFKFANLIAELNGTTSIDTKADSELNFQLQLPSLAGWPALVPAFNSPEASGLRDSVDLSAANGSFAVKGSLNGPLLNPKQLDVTIEQLDVSALRLPLNFQSVRTANSVKGQILGALSLKGKKEGDKISVQSSSGEFNLSSLGIDFPGLIKKSPKVPLTVVWRAGGTPESIRFDQFDIKTDQAQMSINGRFQHLKSGWSADAGLQASANLLPLYDFLPVLLPIRKLLGAAQLQTSLKLVGELAADAPLQSPLAISGTVRIDLPKFFVTSEQPKTDAASVARKTPTPPTKPPDFLSSTLFRKANVKIEALVGSAQVGDLRAEKITANFIIANSAIQGGAVVKSIFGGELHLKDLKVANADPTYPLLLSVTGQTSATRLSIKSLLDWLKPEFAKSDLTKDVGGLLAINTHFSIRPFADGTISKNTDADGSFVASGARFSSRPLTQIARLAIEEKVKDIPGYETWGKPYLQPARTSDPKNLFADIRSLFSLKNGVLTLGQLVLTTPEQDELKAKGTVDLALNANLTGEVRLKSATIGGSFREANSDLTGRLIVPIAFKGPLNAPSAEIAAETLNVMAKNVAALELKKLKVSTKARVDKEIDKKKAEVIDSIKDELKKGLGL